MDFHLFFSQPSIKVEDDNPIPSTSAYGMRPTLPKRKRHIKRNLTFKSYILRVKRLIKPEMKLSTKALEDVDNLISSIYHMYCSELTRLSNHTKKKTLSLQQVEIATKLCIPGRLKSNAIEFSRGILNYALVNPLKLRYLRQ
ncbi:histone domain-containing protein [Trichonephila clavipes]|nr:histone domain-containing protein [Trichonephila clavipes]